MTPITYANAHDAIRDGNAKARPARPVGIAYGKGKGGWRLYDFTDGCPEGWTPDFICFGSGRLPIPISDVGKTIIAQMLERNAK